MAQWLQQGGRNVLELPGPVRLFDLDQHNGLRAAAAGDHVDPGYAGLDRRHGCLNGRLVHIFEGDLGTVRHAAKGDALEALLRAEVFPRDRDLVPRLHAARLDLRGLATRSHVTDRGCVGGSTEQGTLTNAPFPAAVSRCLTGLARLTGSLVAECLSGLLDRSLELGNNVHATCCGSWDTAIISGLAERGEQPVPFLNII